jgi:hypothetical protein
MLNDYHRAVYRLHYRLQRQMDQKRVYYVVEQIADNVFRILLVTCCPTAQAVPLPQEEGHCVQCFTAKGTDISRLDHPRGRYRQDQPVPCYDVALCA